jgi:hypothetical protein
MQGRKELRGVRARPPSMRDPLGIARNIPCVKTEIQRESALNVVRYSRDHAKAACSAKPRDTAEAIRQWDIAFNDRFLR